MSLVSAYPGVGLSFLRLGIYVLKREESLKVSFSLQSVSPIELLGAEFKFLAVAAWSSGNSENSAIAGKNVAFPKFCPSPI